MKTLLQRSAITLVLLGANHTLAGGLWLTEYGDFAGGRANAGAAAGVDEASTIIQNPASGGRIEGSQLFVAGGAFIPRVKFDVHESVPGAGQDNGGQAALVAPSMAFAYVHDLGSDKWSVGIALAGLSGAGLDYNDEWVGRYQATDVKLTVLGLDPTVSYRVTDKFSVGVSAVLYYASLELKVRIPGDLPPRPPGHPGNDDAKAKLDGDEWDVGFKLGATYAFSPYTRVGILYQSELNINFDGKLKIQSEDLQADSSTKQDMAQYVRVGLHHDLNDRLGLDFTVGWDDWSALDGIFVSVDTGAGADLAKGWEDTYHYAAGFSYKLTEDWDLTAGIAYDTNPVHSRDRTADLAVDRQVRYNAGARYELSETTTLGGYVNYTDLGSAKIDAHLFSGEYSSNEIYSFSVYANWKL